MQEFERLSSEPGVGDSHKGPLITGEKPIFSQITKTQMNSQIINQTQNNHGLLTGAHGPGNLSSPSNSRPQHPTGETPLRSRGTTPYRRNSASRGLDAPSGETPSRSRAMRALGQVSASLEALAGLPLPHPLPDPSINCFDTTRAPGSKANPRHANSLTPPGYHILALFCQPSWLGHPRHYTALCGKASVSSVTLCRPLSYDSRAAPSKEDGRTLEKGTDAYLAPARDDAVTSDQ
jgi:hypothetical protein